MSFRITYDHSQYRNGQITFDDAAIEPPLKRISLELDCEPASEDEQTRAVDGFVKALDHVLNI